jgi:hypothetical protein
MVFCSAISVILIPFREHFQMTVFATKRMNITDWAKVQEKIATLQIALGSPHDLMMLSRDVNDNVLQQDIFIGLPHPDLMTHFPGFKEVSRSDLPDYMTMLVVREDGLEALFPDIFRKRRNSIL